MTLLPFDKSIVRLLGEELGYPVDTDEEVIEAAMKAFTQDRGHAIILLTGQGDIHYVY